MVWSVEGIGLNGVFLTPTSYSFFVPNIHQQICLFDINDNLPYGCPVISLGLAKYRCQIAKKFMHHHYESYSHGCYTCDKMLSVWFMVSYFLNYEWLQTLFALP